MIRALHSPFLLCPPLLLAGCITTGFGPSPLDNPPPANPAITDVPAVDATTTVQCDGPADQVTALGTLCGADATSLSWVPFKVDGGKGFATQVGSPGGVFLLIYLRDVGGSRSYAAYVLLNSSPEPANETGRWGDGEAVSGGQVVTTSDSGGCSGSSWTGAGMFLWRSTTIRLSWHAGEPC